MYAKIDNNNVVLQFPYSWDNLVVDNPYTAFDSRFSLIDWYAQTEPAILTNTKLVAVIDQEEPPNFNKATELITKNTVPTLVDGQWVLGWTVREKTEAELVVDTRNPDDL